MVALLIFIKNAEKGKVKTRLAQTVGDDQALKIYQALLGHTRNIASSIRANRLLFYSSFVEKNDDWSPDDFLKLVQEGDDLGARMENAFRYAFQQHRKVIIIGSDCASLSTEIVESAVRALDNYDFVIGPALDGGYYLLGMREYEPVVFRDIAWSTEKVFLQTTQQILQLQKSYFLLPELSDIDYEEDWQKYGWTI